jgi:hypothetical protein
VFLAFIGPGSKGILYSYDAIYSIGVYSEMAIGRKDSPLAAVVGLKRAIHCDGKDIKTGRTYVAIFLFIAPPFGSG